MTDRLDYIQRAKDLTGSTDIEVLIEAARKLESFNTSVKPTGVPLLFPDFCPYAHIQHPTRGMLPLILYEYQQELAYALWRRATDPKAPLIHLTGRHMGSASILCAFALWFGLTSRRQKITMLFPTMELANAARERIHLMQVHLPYEFSPGYSHERGFRTGIGSEISFGSFGSKASQDSARDSDLLILSDVAFLSYSLDSVYRKLIEDAATDSRMVVASSIANKPAGLFYALCNEAGERDKIVHRWNSHPERDQNWAASFRIALGTDNFAREMECEFRS